MTDIVSLYNQYKNEKITTEPKSNKTIENEKSKSLKVDQNSKDEQGITINLIVWVIGFIVILSIIIGNFNKIKKED